VLLPLLAVHGGSSTWIAVAVALAEAAIYQFLAPARSALFPRIVGHNDLARANALQSIGFNAAVLIGPPLGTLLLRWLGLTAVALVDATSYALVAAGAALMILPRQEESDDRPTVGASNSFLREWIEGLWVMRSERWLLGLFVVEGTAMVGGGMVWVLLIIFIRGVLHHGALEYGWFLSLNAVGGIAGSFVVGYLARHVPSSRLVAAGAMSVGVLFLLIAQLRSLPVLLALSPFLAIGGVAWTVAATTMVQQGVRDGYLGRVFGAYGAVASLAVLLGLGVGSALGGTLNATLLLSAAGLLYILAGIVAMITLPRAGAKSCADPSRR
jgi:predicted MFS family arabinose efflux permease